MAGPNPKSIRTDTQYFYYVSVNPNFEKWLVEELGKINIIMKPVEESSNDAPYPRMILKYIENARDYLKEMETLNDVMAKLHVRDVLVLILRQIKTSKSQNEPELQKKQKSTNEKESKNKPESTNEKESKNKPESTNEKESQNKPEPTNEHESQNKPESINDKESQNKPEPTNEQQSQNKLEPTNEQQSQNKPESTNEQQSQNKPESTNEQESKNKPESTNEQQSQNKPESTNEQQSQNKPESINDKESQNKPESTNEQELQNEEELYQNILKYQDVEEYENKRELNKEQQLENEKELHLFKNIVAQKAKCFAFAYDRATPDKVLITAAEFVKRALNITLVPAQDVQESPLLVICKNDSQLQEDIDNAKKRSRAGEDVMLLVVTASENLRLVDTKATEGFGSKAKLKWDFHRKRFSRKENQKCIECLQTFFQRYGCGEWLPLGWRDSMKHSLRIFWQGKSMDVFSTLPDVSVKIEKGVENRNTTKQIITPQGEQSKTKPLVLFKTDKELTEEYVPYFCDSIRLTMKQRDEHWVVHFCYKTFKMSNEILERIKAGMAEASESPSTKTKNKGNS